MRCEHIENLYFSNKRKFVNEDIEIRSNFKEITHDAIAYVLACFGFVAE